MKFSFYTYLLLALVAVSCHKPKAEPEAVPLPAELKSYVLFQPGTYWIYQDSATQQLDSVWVVSTEKRIVLIGRSATNPEDKHEDFRLRVRSSRGGVDQEYSVFRTCGLPYREDRSDKGPCWYIERKRYRPNSTDDEGDTEVFPYAVGHDTRLYMGYSTLMTVFWHSTPTLLGGQSYPDVLEVSLGHDVTELGWRSYYAWVPGKGIIMHRTWPKGEAQTWTLLRSRIVQE